MTGADLVTLTDAQITQEQSDALDALDNFDLGAVVVIPDGETPITVEIPVPELAAGDEFTFDPINGEDGDVFVFLGESQGVQSLLEASITNFTAGKVIDLQQVGIAENIGGIELNAISVDGDNMVVNLFAGDFLNLETWNLTFEAVDADLLAAVDAAEDFTAQVAAVDNAFNDGWLLI